MSVGPLGIIGGVASTPANARAASVDRAHQDTSEQSREIQSATFGEKAAGVGETGEEQKASDRDADGRRLWERPQRRNRHPADATESTDLDSANPSASPKDASGELGEGLDLSG